MAERAIRIQDRFRPDAALAGGRHPGRADQSKARGTCDSRGNNGGPRSLKLDKLISWSRHGDPSVKYFSGTATYRKTFRMPPEALAAGRAVYLDLGKVAVIAQVTLNGKDLGILWKAPFRIEATASPAGRR